MTGLKDEAPVKRNLENRYGEKCENDMIEKGRWPS